MQIVYCFQMQFCNFGFFMISLDINNDGKDDFVIGLFFVSVKNLIQNGMVIVLFLLNSLGKIMFEESNVVIILF